MLNKNKLLDKKKKKWSNKLTDNYLYQSGQDVQRLINGFNTVKL